MTLEQKLEQFQSRTNPWIKNLITENNLRGLPDNLTLIAFKKEQLLKVFAKIDGKKLLLTEFAFTVLSGTIGPKLLRGDKQIPEGIYRIESLNPNSSYHASLKINYPNEFDLAQGKKDGREDLGDNIFIHGGMASIGCLAIGDENIEKLFTLVALIGHDKVIISPWNFSKSPVPKDGPEWITDLYKSIQVETKKWEI